MEKLPEEINLIAKRGFLMYADGYMAQIISIKFGEDQDGKQTYDFILDPSEELIKRYNLKPNKNTKLGMFYSSQYPYYEVECLNVDPSWTRYLYIKTYDGKTTPAMDNLAGIKSKEVIKKLLNEIKILKESLEVTKEERDMLKSNMPAYLKKNIGPLLDVITPIMKEVGKKE